MAQLQQPAFVHMNGRLTAWDDARIHVGSEALTRGISVFEGIKGYWSHDGADLGLLALEAHYERLVRSALIQHLPFETSFADFTAACRELVGALKVPDKDLWLRPTLISVDGQWGVATTTDLVITCYHQEKVRPAPMDVGVSTWQRATDVVLPARLKSSANYQGARLARIEGRRQGFDDMLLVNASGRIAEATGSCVVLVRSGTLVTPPAYEGCLESITVDILEQLSVDLGLRFERRPVDRTELYVADAICLVGTLMEMGRVRRVEDRHLPESSPELDALEDAFWAAVRRQRPHPAVVLTLA